MIKISPFQAYHYNSRVVSNIESVVAPPYDIISLKERDELYSRHPYNIIRVILGKEHLGDSESDNKYTRARDFLNLWISKEIVIQDKAPAVYVLSQKFFAGAQGYRERTGFICLLDVNASDVVPHEKTRPEPKVDRLNLLKQCRTHFSPIFLLYQEKNNAHVIEELLTEVKTSKTPDTEFRDLSGTDQMLWRVADENIVIRIVNVMSESAALIADGHHRFAVARQFSGSSGYPYIMAYFVPASNENVCILPTHRYVKTEVVDQKNMERKFDQKEITKDEVVTSVGKQGADFLAVWDEQNGWRHLKPRSGVVEPGELNVTWLHRLLLPGVDLKDIDFIQGIDFVTKAARERGGCAFVLNPPSAKQVMDTVTHGRMMPLKSTYFHPKLLSGLVMNKF